MAKFLIAVLAAQSCLVAQAWLFPKGEGAVALSYQNMFIRDHVFSAGDAHDVGHVLSHAMTLDVDYSLTEKLAVRIAIPFVTARYYGPKPHPTAVDDGAYHSTFQDFTVDVRYNLARRPAAITPFFRAVVPSNNYPYFAHAAAGRNLHEYQVGANLGRRLNPVLPRAYLQARYSYAFVERIVGIAPNRSNAEVQVGYFLTRRLVLLGNAAWMYTHSGVTWRFGAPQLGLPLDQWLHHDQISRTSLLDVGGGAAFALKPSVQLFLSVATSVAGRNAHMHAAVSTVGMSKTFHTRGEHERAAVAEVPDAPQKAFVCTCAKSK